jgi:hypothetical protein
VKQGSKKRSLARIVKPSQGMGKKEKNTRSAREDRGAKDAAAGKKRRGRSRSPETARREVARCDDDHDDDDDDHQERDADDDSASERGEEATEARGREGKLRSRSRRIRSSDSSTTTRNGKKRTAEEEDDGFAGTGGDDDDDSSSYCWIKASKRANVFACPNAWWMVDLHAQPAPKQGATPLVRRCVRELGWSEAWARRVLVAYRQFLHVKKVKKDWDDTLLSPTVPVDQMWQKHILDGNNYSHDCMFLCGRVVGRDPDGAADKEAWEERRSATQQALIKCYGEFGFDQAISGPWMYWYYGEKPTPPDSPQR